MGTFDEATVTTGLHKLLTGRILTLLAVTVAGGCLPSATPNRPAAPVERAPVSSPTPDRPVDRFTDGPRVRPVNLNVPSAPITQETLIDLAAAKNETVSFAVQIASLPPASNRRAYVLRVTEIKRSGGGDAISPDNLSAYQILPMPIDVNRAGFVRHTGLPGDRTSMPRALLPQIVDRGALNLATVRDPSRPFDPQSRAAGSNQPVTLWFDLRIPPQTPPGDYRASVDLVETAAASGAISTVPLKITVHDFVLPDERHLQMVGKIDWTDLARLFADRFESVRPMRLSRTEPAYAAPVKTLDALVRLAQQNRVSTTFSHLQPVVKWPAGKPAEVEWAGYDSVVRPWFSGDDFADRVPVGFWALPTPDYFATYDPQSRGEYLAQAAAHFDQLDWMTRSAIPIGEEVIGRANAEQSLRYSAEAQSVVSLHPRMRVQVPVSEDQLQLAGDDKSPMLARELVQRLIAAAPPLVSASPLARLPDDVKRPALWLRADLSDAASSGLTPYVGAGGDEYDVRLWAWLAFLRNATMIQWTGVLPRADTPTQAADPNELIWFYPGSWFGVEDPLPTVQLKWLRNAQQDYEYLWLARQRGQTINAFLMARLITKPVEIQPNQPQDPTYALMCGTANPIAWREAKQLLVDNILLREPGVPIDKKQETIINNRMLRWSTPQERPVLVGRSTSWTRDTLAGPGQSFINLRLGIDIYNASDTRPDQNSLQWTATYPGVEASPKPISIAALATYQVKRFTLEARIDPTLKPSRVQSPVELTFTNGYTREEAPVKLVVPVAVSDRRDRPLNINGDLDDWTAEDAIIDAPLVQMFNRPSLQAGVLPVASTSSNVLTGWSDERFYVAFKVDGLPLERPKLIRNFVSYQFRRAWGEDLCQLLIQPVYADNTPGPVLHVVCKSNGSVWVERKTDPKLAVNPWQSFEGAGINYQARLDGSQWRGEVAIPWAAIIDAAKAFGPDGRPTRPALLRFNFTQHKSLTGESATWAGPVDFGRDDAFTGVLLLRDPDIPGMPRN